MFAAKLIIPNMKPAELEERLIDFSVEIISVVESIPNTKSGNHLSGQLLRSGTSVSLNYGEAQAAKSTKDFVHKMKVVLKELRESLNCIRIIQKANLHDNIKLIRIIKKENNELVAIFVASLKTASKSNK